MPKAKVRPEQASLLEKFVVSRHRKALTAMIWPLDTDNILAVPLKHFRRDLSAKKDSSALLWRLQLYLFDKFEYFMYYFSGAKVSIHKIVDFKHGESIKQVRFSIINC